VRGGGVDVVLAVLNWTDEWMGVRNVC